METLGFRDLRPLPAPFPGDQGEEAAHMVIRKQEGLHLPDTKYVPQSHTRRDPPPPATPHPPSVTLQSFQLIPIRGLIH